MYVRVVHIWDGTPLKMSLKRGSVDLNNKESYIKHSDNLL